MNSYIKVSAIKLFILLAMVCAVRAGGVAKKSVLKKIDLYTFYTPSHKVFMDEWFLPTLNDEEINLIVEEYPQECATGKVFSPGWQSAMLRKVDLIIRAIESHMPKDDKQKDDGSDIFIYADCDIQFFQPIGELVVKLLGDKDLVFQRDTPSGTVCAGFSVCRANKKTLAFYHGVRDYMVSQKECSDQKTVNRLLRKGTGKDRNRYKIVWDYLPSDFLGGGTLTGSAWSPKKHLFIPRDIVLHHANWTTGNHNKLAQLAYVRKMVEQKK